MDLYFHGGMCCGIKTIAGFCGHTNSNEYHRPAQKFRSNDTNGDDVSTERPFFTDEAPKEPAIQRLDRLIAFCKKYRPKGAIEIVLMRTQYNTFQIGAWEQIILERGFKQYVPEFENSNSGNFLRIYHLITTEEKGTSDPYDEDDEYDDPFYDEDEEEI